MFEKPGVQFALHAGQGLDAGRRVGRDDQKLAGGVGDLAGGRQTERFQHPQCRALGQQRYMKRPPPQQLGGAPLGLATAGENEILDAGKIALHQQELLFGPIGALA